MQARRIISSYTHYHPLCSPFPPLPSPSLPIPSLPFPNTRPPSSSQKAPPRNRAEHPAVATSICQNHPEHSDEARLQFRQLRNDRFDRLARRPPQMILFPSPTLPLRDDGIQVLVGGVLVAGIVVFNLEVVEVHLRAVFVRVSLGIARREGLALRQGLRPSTETAGVGVPYGVCIPR
jgi:hypothetical protein